jgi:hypothetical protein
MRRTFKIAPACELAVEIGFSCDDIATRIGESVLPAFFELIFIIIKIFLD